MTENEHVDEPCPAQIGTLLAALRYYQEGLQTGSIPIRFLEIASDDGIEVPLTVEDIDELCERING